MTRLSRGTDRRHLVRFGIAILAIGIALAGCKGGDSTSPPAPPPPPPPPPPHEDQWNVVAGRSWQMPAQTEGYVCYTARATSDQYISGFRLVSPSPVQNEVMITLTNGPVTEGNFDCGAGSLGPHLIYAASQGTTPIEFPAGFGVRVPAGQYIWLNIHLVNTSDTAVSDSTRIEGRADSASGVTTAMDMMLLGTFLINIPSDGLEHTASGACLTSEEQHVLAFLPLMRSRAVHQKVTLLQDTTTRTVYDEDFDWQHATYVQPSTPLDALSSSRFTTVCSYVNNSGTTKTYGEASENESCFDAIYHYPISASNLEACALGNNFDIRRE